MILNIKLYTPCRWLQGQEAWSGKIWLGESELTSHWILNWSRVIPV